MNVDEAIFGGMVVSDTDSNMTFCYPLELGHLVVDMHGERCNICGNRGCLETLCKTPKLFQALNEQGGMALAYSQDFGSDLNTANMALIKEQLEKGNPRVQAVLQDYAQTLCTAISSISNLLNVRSVHISGDIALLGEPFLTILRNTYRTLCHPMSSTALTRLELFVNDYEQVRLAATIMCLDAIFRKQAHL